MEAHRIRKAKRRYTENDTHIFLEVEKNRWLEVETLDNINYESIHEYLEIERKTGMRVVGFTDQNFQWGTIKDWTHAGLIRKLIKKK
jgi:hypothetical protein